MNKLISLVVFGLLASSSLMLKAQSGYKIINQIHLEGDGGWDYLSVDEPAGRLYVSHGTMALVVDLKTGKQVGKIPDTNGIHGIAAVSSLNKGFTSNGRENKAGIVDLETLKLKREAGCDSVSFGVETGNPEMLKMIRKGITLDQVRHAVSLCREAGIIAHTSFIGFLRDKIFSLLQGKFSHEENQKKLKDG